MALELQEFKKRIKAVKKITTQLNKIADRASVEAIEASQSTSSDLTAYIFVSESESPITSDRIMVETNFFGKGANDLIKVTPDNPDLGESFQLKLSEVEKLPKKLSEMTDI